MPQNPDDPMDDLRPELLDDDLLDGAVDAPSVIAPDQTDRVILAEVERDGIACPCDVLVIEDATGALTDASLEALRGQDGARVLSWHSSARRSRELAARFDEQIADGSLVLPGGPEPVELAELAARAEAHHVLARLPKALHTLEERARAVAGTWRGETIHLVAGGRVKHMTRQQNELLGRIFDEVHATRGIGKSRGLVATGIAGPVEPARPAEGRCTVPVRGSGREIALRGIGGVFGGASADAGSQLLLQALDRAVADGQVTLDQQARAVDLGSGNGLLTAYLATAFPDARVLASDDDADAVRSTRATLAASGLDTDRVTVTWDDALSRQEEGSADLVLLNPPFHDGPGMDPTLVKGMLDAAARVLRPGGELWMVHNSHLRYRTEMERRVGPVRQRSRDRRFTVLSATRS